MKLCLISWEAVGKIREIYNELKKRSITAAIEGDKETANRISDIARSLLEVTAKDKYSRCDSIGIYVTEEKNDRYMEIMNRYVQAIGI